MCELFAVTARKKTAVNSLLETFFSHSEKHRNGWGLYIKDSKTELFVKEHIKASDSTYLANLLKDEISTSLCMAHIRYATIGDVSEKNTHPFIGTDKFGRQWVLCHNGTIFESDVLNGYHYLQKGSTDSERVFLYLIDRINKAEAYDASSRMRVVEDVIDKTVPGNKLNLVIFDGEFLYVHKNEAGTLFYKETNGGKIFATLPLDEDRWIELPSNKLHVYKDGELVYEGRQHVYTYIYDPEKMKVIYMAYANL